jgi:hypothetical protein
MIPAFRELAASGSIPPLTPRPLRDLDEEEVLILRERK